MHIQIVGANFELDPTTGKMKMLGITEDGKPVTATFDRCDFSLHVFNGSLNRGED